MFCINCGKSLENSFKFCPYCGTSIKGENLHNTAITSDSGFDIRDGVLVKYTGRASHVIVPEGVRVIGKYTFCEEKAGYKTQNEYVEKITLPDSVTKIESYAFYRCVNLTEIVFSNQITEIGEGAFFECINLLNVVLPDSITVIKKKAFGRCRNLSSVVLPKHLTVIKRETFEGCEKLTYVDMPNTLTTIEANAFWIPYGTSGSIPGSCPLNETRIPDSVTKMEETGVHEKYYGGLRFSTVDENILNKKYKEIYRKSKKLCLYCGGALSILGKCKTCGKVKNY